jgi:tetratricopeptide (TPR) repeat protein
MEDMGMEELEIILKEINNAIQMFENMRQAGILPDESVLAAAYTQRGLFYCQINMFNESISDFDKSIEIMERLRREHKSPSENERAKAYAGRGMLYNVIGEYTQAASDLTNCIDILERLQKQGQLVDENMLCSMYKMRGGALNYMAENMDDAISDYRKSIVIAERLKLAGEPFDEDGLALAYMGIAQSYDQKEDFAEANKHYDKCIEIWERLKQTLSDESNLATAYMNRGCNYFSMGENGKALSNHNKCISIRERLKCQGIEQDVYYVSLSYRNRALHYKAVNDITAALKDYISAVSVLKEEFLERSDLQEMYYEYLTELIDLIDEQSNNSLYNNVLQEFLYSMRSVQKTVEAEEAQNNILTRKGVSRLSSRHGLL